MDNIFTQRIKRTLSYLEEQKLDVAMITSPTNIYYLTGFYCDPLERFMALVFDVEKGIVQLFVPSIDLESAAKATGMDGLTPISDMDQPYTILKNWVGRSISQLGVEKKMMSLFQAERLKECFSDVRFVDVEEFITSMRLIKSSEDIQIVRRAIEVIEKVLQHGVSKVVPGVTELEITAELEYQMKVLGADRPAFETILLSGPQSALPHGRPGQRKIQSGEFLLFDLGVFVDGYCSDITRTFVVGEASEEQKSMYDAVLQGNLRGIEAVQAGKSFGEVDRAAREYIESAGYGQYFIHRLGHGLGLDVHEAPSIHGQNEMTMQPGMLFTIEPGVYISGVGGIRIEDDVFIGEDGKANVLTTYPKHLIEL
ncbi:aminopeptidase P family protein [Ammoniphilus sp. CFH 90114]|nr:aminopeptidase P family protein [Ammoniphilus sp. CFH 90114]